ncbi:hypothetical protein [Brevibacterium marinum]|uniref:Putative flippase GtrA n=1 Tax=Brevibacterium marinum TaxID=418643 RepID=A0A846RU92_9MICO|nr:hypothetical protein [Brevibacterium marinum]NJC57704.1 putative flippase GtrA [Brevibacterium marinum]
MNRDTAMIDILGRILSRLVSVALFIVIALLALVFLRESLTLDLALLALISAVIGVVGTIALRYLFRLLHSVGDLFS